MLPTNYIFNTPEDAVAAFRQTIGSVEAELDNQLPATDPPCNDRGGTHWDVVNWEQKKIGSIVCCPCCQNVPGAEPVVHPEYCGFGNIYASPQ